MKKKLRFAPIIRVSTERQEKQGESLRTQKSQIIDFVDSLNGIIPENCWNYSGQEHATPGQERIKLEKLLEDSGKGIYDAVIVCDASRWSRDNLKSKEGLEILRKNNIRFFVGTMEYDLYSPEHIFYLGMSAEIGELQARTQKLKSINSKIHMAKRGIPSVGSLPYGRTYDKEAKEEERWGVDEEKKEIIQQAAKRYLDGESLPEIATSINMGVSTLWTILKKTGGTEWPLKFQNDALNINETVIMEVPRLLEDSTIEAIKKKAQANRTYTRGDKLKYRYLLGRMIFCSRCGKALTGMSHNQKSRYYQHRYEKGATCKFKHLIKADEIENAVLIQIVQTMGDPVRIQKAIERASPDMKKVEDLKKELERLMANLKNISRNKEKTIDGYVEGIFNKEDSKRKMDKLYEQEDLINSRLSVIKNELANIPDPDRIKQLSKWAVGITADITKNPKFIFTKSYEHQRKVVESAFAGHDAKGNRLGVYMDESGDPKTPWSFEIRGLVENTVLSLPLSDEYLEEAFNLDPYYQDIDKELENIKTSFCSL